MISFRLLTIAFLLCPFGACHVASERSDTRDHISSAPPTAHADPTTSRQPDDIGDRTYHGCWQGMGGARVRITKSAIDDLGSGEQSRIKVRQRGRREFGTGLETGAVYLFEALPNKFSRSFLSVIIEISFNSDNTVGIRTYDSYEDYLENRISGQGLFERADCKTVLN